MKLLLIAGHGNGDPGAVSIIDGKPYREEKETRTVVSALREALTGYSGLEVTVYPENKNAFEDGQFGSMAQQIYLAEFDLVIEVHFNSAAKDADGNGKTTGVECFVPAAEKAVRLESGICQNISSLGLRNRGVKKYNWAVINRARKAGCHACLLEVCFIDDKDDMTLYLAKKTEIAQAIARAVAETYHLEKEDEDDMKRYNSMAEIPAWGQEAVKKLVLAGKLNGKGAPKDAQGYPTDMDLSEDMLRLIVMLG